MNTDVVAPQRQRSKCNSLIQGDITADLCSLAYNNAGCMVQKETRPNSRAWVDVDASLAVSPFGIHDDDLISTFG